MTSNRKRRKPLTNRPKPKSIDEQMVETYRHASLWGKRINKSVTHPEESKWPREKRTTQEREWKLAFNAELKSAKEFLQKINTERKKRGQKALTINELIELIRKTY